MFIQKNKLGKEDIRKCLKATSINEEITSKIIDPCFSIYKICARKKSEYDIQQIAHKKGISGDITRTRKIINILLSIGAITEDTRLESYYECLKEGQIPDRGLIPDDVDWFITYKCNLNCNMCFLKRGPLRKNNHSKEYKGIKNKDELKKDEVMEIIDQLHENGVSSISFSGGEPFVREDFQDIIRYSTEKGLVGEVATNGLLIGKNMSEYLMKNDWKVTISLDGMEKHHEKIRGVPGCFRKTTNTIREMIKAKEKYNKGNICIRCTLQKRNVDDIENLIAFKESINADEIEFNLLTLIHPNNLVDETFYRKLYVIVEKLYERGIREPFKWGEHLLKGEISRKDVIGCEIARNIMKRKRPACLVTGTIFSIDPFGNVRPCCSMIDQKHVMGNLKEDPFMKIWRGRRFSEFRKGLSSIDINKSTYWNCRYCDQFPENIRMASKIMGKNK